MTLAEVTAAAARIPITTWTIIVVFSVGGSYWAVIGILILTGRTDLNDPNWWDLDSDKRRPED